MSRWETPRTALMRAKLLMARQYKREEEQARIRQINQPRIRPNARLNARQVDDRRLTTPDDYMVGVIPGVPGNLVRPEDAATPYFPFASERKRFSSFGRARERARQQGFTPTPIAEQNRISREYGESLAPSEQVRFFGTLTQGEQFREAYGGGIRPGADIGSPTGEAVFPGVVGKIPGLRTPPEAASTIGTFGVGSLPMAARAGGLALGLGGAFGGGEVAERTGVPRPVGEVIGGLGGGLAGGYAGPIASRRIGTNLSTAVEQRGGVAPFLAAETGGTRIPRRAPTEPENPLQKMTSWLNESGSALAKGRTERRAQVAALRSRQAGALSSAYKRGDLTPQEQFLEGQRLLAGTAGETPIGKPPLDEVETGALLTSLRDFPTWQNRPFKSMNAQKGLLKLMNGELPGQYELGLLEQAFGSEFVKSASRASGNKWREAAAALGLPRTVRTILDVSFPLRQGIALAPRHPKEVFGNIPRGIASTFSERVAQQWDEATRMKSRAVSIVDDNGAPRSWSIGELQDEAGLFLPRIDQRTGELAERTEEFMSTQGGDTWVSRVFGPVTRPFQRNFVTLGNATRSDIFENTITSPFFHHGKPVTMEDARALAWLINVGTGRGDLGGLNRYGALLAQPLFSPRLIAGRIEHAFSPAILATGAGGAPKSLMASQLAAQQLVSFIGAGVGLLAVGSQIPGVRVDPNILSGKWGKLEIGKGVTTKIDLFGGYLQYARFIAQLYTAKGRSASGEEYERKRWDIVENFLRNKSAPNVATVWDLLSEQYGTTGEKMDLKTAAGIRTFLWNEFAPLSISDIMDAVNRDDGFKPQWAFVAPFSTLGGGVQTYGDSPVSAIFSIPRYKGLSVEEEKQLREFYKKVDQWRREQVEEFGEADSTYERSIERVAEQEGFNAPNMVEWAKALRNEKQRERNINPEWDQYILDHWEEIKEEAPYLITDRLRKLKAAHGPASKAKRTPQSFNPAIPRIGRNGQSGTIGGTKRSGYPMGTIGSPARPMRRGGR